MKLLFTDTDSLMVEVHGKNNIYDIMKEHSEEFDFGNYPINTSVFQKLTRKYLVSLKMIQSKSYNIVSNANANAKVVKI